MPTSASRVLLAGLMAVAPASAQQFRTAEPYPGNRPDIVRCESSKGRSVTCKADTRGGARLVRQLSRSPCVEGETWGVREGEVWVRGGCRADFGLGDTKAGRTGPAVPQVRSHQHRLAASLSGVDDRRRAVDPAVVEVAVHPAQHLGLRPQQRVGVAGLSRGIPDRRRPRGGRKTRPAASALRIRSRPRTSLRSRRVAGRADDQAVVEVAVRAEPQLGLGPARRVGEPWVPRGIHRLVDVRVKRSRTRRTPRSPRTPPAVLISVMAKMSL